MPTRNRVPLIFAVAMLATSGCRDDMQPDNLAGPGAKATASTSPRSEQPASDMPASDAVVPSTDASADPDRSFTRSALASGITEVKISRDVEERSPTSDVRTLAKRIADDHEALNGKLRSFAGPDADAVDTDASAKAMDALIRSSEGTDLDRAYLQHMADGHARSIARYEAAAKTGRDDGLRTLARDALPKLREHASAVNAQLSRAK